MLNRLKTVAFLAKKTTYKYNYLMNKKNVLLIFILSFLCVIFTLNNLCFKYADNRIDSFLLLKKYDSVENFNKAVSQNNSDIQIMNENTRLVITLTISVILFFVFSFTTPIQSSLIMIFFIIAYFISYKIAANHFLFINLFGVILSMIIAKIFADTYKKIFKENVNRKIENILGKYISKDIKNQILKNNAETELGGKRAEITVMFADIRGFTSLSETRKAEEVSQLLNEYFSELEPIINKYNGVINKFIGDAVLVVFGDPATDKFHAKSAVKCAYELRNKVKEIKQRWIEEGKPKIDIGVGINTGEAFIGNVGTQNRFEYTVIGDTVNIASRIEDYNKIYKTHVLISENTYNKISQIVDVIKIREVSIKGKTKKINIYEVLRITE